MLASSRALRTTRYTTLLRGFRTSRCPPFNSYRAHSQTNLSSGRSYVKCPSTAAYLSQPQRAAFDPVTLLLAVTLATGVAYIVTTSSSNDASPEPSEEKIRVASDASLFPLTMAPDMPPGRPGTLTAEQETKLKEMWIATLEIFGVIHETHDSGTPNPAESSTTDKKKKKSRLSMFRKKDKDGDSDSASAGDSADNDKHGQTKEFQQALATDSPETLREAFWSMSKHDHPDALLLRFLRARKWDVHAAIVMMISTLHWRLSEMKVDEDIMKNGEEGALKDSKDSSSSSKKDGEDFLSQLRMGKSFLHGTDKEGRPCCYCRVRLHRPGQQTEKSLERFTVYTIETTRMMLRPPVDTAVRSTPPHFSRTQLTPHRQSSST